MRRKTVKMDCSQEHIGMDGLFPVRERNECVKSSVHVRLPRRKIVNSPLTLAREVNQPIVAFR